VARLNAAPERRHGSLLAATDRIVTAQPRFLSLGKHAGTLVTGMTIAISLCLGVYFSMLPIEVRDSTPLFVLLFRG
jgi:hypothetical protein